MIAVPCRLPAWYGRAYLPSSLRAYSASPALPRPANRRPESLRCLLARECARTGHRRRSRRSPSSCRAYIVGGRELSSSELGLCDDLSEPVDPFDCHDMDPVALGAHSLDGAHGDLDADIFRFISGSS